MRSLVALDIDGVLFPLGRNYGDPVIVPPGHLESQICRMKLCHLPGLGEWLTRLSERADLRWASSWEPEMLRELETHFGLSSLPRIPVSRARSRFHALREAAEAAGNPPVVWCEDQPPGAGALGWKTERVQSGQPTLFIRPPRHLGLSAAQCARVLHFLEEQSAKP